MRTLNRTLSILALTTALSAPILIGGCGGGGYRTYDPYYNDYHVWNNDEVVYYNNWEHDTHRNHVDYRKRKPDEQKEYWNYRHSHDNNHNNDHH
jgi:hypothetical protein